MEYTPKLLCRLIFAFSFTFLSLFQVGNQRIRYDLGIDLSGLYGSVAKQFLNGGNGDALVDE